VANLLPILGVALSLGGAHTHRLPAATVTPHVASWGQEIRVALPPTVPSPSGLKARIRVAGTTSAGRPDRATDRFVWIRVAAREPSAAAATPVSGMLEAQLTLTSGRRRVLETSFEVRAESPVTATTRPATAPVASSPPATSSPSPIDTSESVEIPTQEAAEGPASEGAAEPPPAPPTEVPQVTGSQALDWAPPTLTAPTVVTVPDGKDPAVLRLSTSKDYVVELPPNGIHGTLEINGGHNVDLVGGEITVPTTANQTDNGADDTDTGLYVRAATGTVHIEGVLIKAESDTLFDGIDVNAPEATVQVENVRVEDVYGSLDSEHADVIQTWGGVKELDVDGLTANGDYQGLMIAPDLGPVGTVNLDHVDMTAEAAPSSLAATASGGGIMVWLTRGKTCESATVSMQDVYVSNLTHRIASINTAWPSPGSGSSCASTQIGETLIWPLLPVSGGVTIGPPPGGPFVPAGEAGNSYVSPGYSPS
jgi:hypothetical protein